MLSVQENERLTRVGPDRPAGQVLRHYWLPAALSEELVGPRPVAPVTLLGERLVLFRNPDGTLGLIGRRCPHRGVDLCVGRLEEGGLRCPFHGWLFDRHGACLEQPAEPEGSNFHTKVRHTAYPVVEHNGIVFAYLGPGTPPPLPGLDCFRAPDSHVFAFKGLWQCNWLQALEVGIDPAHASFLHRFLEDEDPSEGYGRQFRDTADKSGIPMTRLLRDYPRPELRIDETDFGLRLTALRDLGNGQTHVRVTNQIFPCAIVIPMSNEMTITQWHVPIDDVTCYWYAMFTSFGAPVDKVTMREQRLREHRLPDYAPLKNASNNYGYDPEEQARETYTGMGSDINVHDQWACESMGAIQDRSREHLGTTDVGIIRYRKRLRGAIEALAGARPQDLPFRVTADDNGALGPVSIDAIAPSADWTTAAALRDRERRDACPWDARLA